MRAESQLGLSMELRKTFSPEEAENTCYYFRKYVDAVGLPSISHDKNFVIRPIRIKISSLGVFLEVDVTCLKKLNRQKVPTIIRACLRVDRNPSVFFYCLGEASGSPKDIADIACVLAKVEDTEYNHNTDYKTRIKETLGYINYKIYEHRRDIQN